MKTLVAGIGNIFFGDDGFGVAVARELDDVAIEGVTVVDYGIRGLHLALELLDGYDVLVLIDALPMGEVPGTVALVEVDTADTPGGTVDAHSMSPAAVLGSLRSLGGSVGSVYVVGCEPCTITEGIGLSPVVESAVPHGAAAVRELLATIGEETRWSAV